MWNFLLAPAAALYKMAVTFRHWLFNRGLLKSEKFDIPIICIGNITVGGTGKTPMAEMVIAHMAQQHRVALLSRGYGRKTKGYREVMASDHYRNVGDEPLQIKMKFPETVVVVCEKRSEGIRRLRKEHPEVDMIIMDDGFQHRYVSPRVNIVMIDSTRPIQHDKMLPQGSLRDIPESLIRAHYFIVTKCPKRMQPIDLRIWRKVLKRYAFQKIYFTRFESFMPQPVFREDAQKVCFEKAQRVIAFAGIGNPKPFLNTLNEQYTVVESVVLKDHHVYRVKNIHRMRDLLVKYPDAVLLTTEKDAVKLQNKKKISLEVRQKLYYLPINITFTEDSDADFFQNLDKDVTEN